MRQDHPPRGSARLPRSRSRSAFKTRVPGWAVIAFLKLAFRDAGVIRPAFSRSVAQSGSAPRSGRGGRRFKSCHSDQLHTQAAELAQLSGKDSELWNARVHKGVHRYALRMVTLRQDSRGNYIARKRLPDDVQGRVRAAVRRSGSRRSSRARQHRSGSEAERLFHEWKAELNARIAAIRAERTGEGIPLTRQQARALAGEWYEWFLARHSRSEKNMGTAARPGTERCAKPLAKSDGKTDDPDELWRRGRRTQEGHASRARRRWRDSTVLGDKNSWCSDNEARALFLDFLYEDLAAALKADRMSKGDYSADKYRERVSEVRGHKTRRDTVAVIRGGGSLNEAEQQQRRELAYVFERWRHFKGRSCSVNNA